MAEATASFEVPQFSPTVESAAKVLFPDQNAIWTALRQAPAKTGELTAPVQAAYQWVDFQLNRFSNLDNNPLALPAYRWDGSVPPGGVVKGRLGLPGIKRGYHPGPIGRNDAIDPPVPPEKIKKRWEAASAEVKAKIQAEAEQIDRQRKEMQPVLAGFEKALQDLKLTDISGRDLCVAYNYRQYRTRQISEKSYYRYFTGRWGLVPDGRRVSIEMAVDRVLDKKKDLR